jgi:glycine/D-amino acid oxidase-like deaminating enzyme
MAAKSLDLREAFSLQCDVLVVGCGAAGLAAAVTARREGLDVLVLERYGFAGGAAVAGLSGTVCGMFDTPATRARNPEQIVWGFADEFVRDMLARGGMTPPVRFGETFTYTHDPLAWREAGDHFLQAAGVRVLFHTTVTEVLAEGDSIVGVKAFTKQGPLEVRARLVIDASGDADVVAMAGLPTFMGHEGSVQNPTMIFRIQGVDVGRFLAAQGEDTIMGPHVVDAIRDAEAKGYRLPRKKIFLFPSPRPGELLCNATRILGRDGRDLNPLLVRDITEAEMLGREQAREYTRFIRAYLPGCEDAFLNDTGVQVGVRQTRQIVAMERLSNVDVLEKRKHPDAIARSAWPIELHAGEKPRVEWLRDDFYEIPYGCFVPARGDNLLVAGRCLSAEHEAMASARVTAQCFAYGQAIGLAAAIAVRERMQPRQVQGRALRAELNRRGARLGEAAAAPRTAAA